MRCYYIYISNIIKFIRWHEFIVRFNDCVRADIRSIRLVHFQPIVNESIRFDVIDDQQFTESILADCYREWGGLGVWMNLS